MAGTIISNFMMFLPEKTKWFCLIGLCIFFFGMYIPYEERKKKKKQARKRAPKQAEYAAAEKSVSQKQLEQLKTLKTAGIISEEEYQEKKKELRRQ